MTEQVQILRARFLNPPEQVLGCLQFLLPRWNHLESAPQDHNLPEVRSNKERTSSVILPIPSIPIADTLASDSSIPAITRGFTSHIIIINYLQMDITLKIQYIVSS